MYNFAAKGIQPTATEYLNWPRCFLSGAAADVYRNLLTIAHQEGNDEGDIQAVSWPDVRKALEQRFGKPLSGHQLILNMIKLRQSTTESVNEFTIRSTNCTTSSRGNDSRHATFLWLCTPTRCCRACARRSRRPSTQSITSSVKRSDPRSHGRRSHRFQRIATAREATLASTRPLPAPQPQRTQSVASSSSGGGGNEAKRPNERAEVLTKHPYAYPSSCLLHVRPPAYAGSAAQLHTTLSIAGTRVTQHQSG